MSRTPTTRAGRTGPETFTLHVDDGGQHLQHPRMSGPPLPRPRRSVDRLRSRTPALGGPFPLGQYQGRLHAHRLRSDASSASHPASRSSSLSRSLTSSSARTGASGGVAVLLRVERGAGHAEFDGQRSWRRTANGAPPGACGRQCPVLEATVVMLRRRRMTTRPRPAHRPAPRSIRHCREGYA